MKKTRRRKVRGRGPGGKRFRPTKSNSPRRRVTSYTRKLKNGKRVRVRGYSRRKARKFALPRRLPPRDDYPLTMRKRLRPLSPYRGERRIYVIVDVGVKEFDYPQDSEDAQAEDDFEEATDEHVRRFSLFAGNLSYARAKTLGRRDVENLVEIVSQGRGWRLLKIWAIVIGNFDAPRKNPKNRRRGRVSKGGRPSKRRKKK